MCDYSLETYESREAKDEEELVLRHFAFSAKGFVNAENEECVVCCKSGVKMTVIIHGTIESRDVADPYGSLRQLEIFDGDVPVTFHTIPENFENKYMHKDGVLLPNGRFSLLWDLPDDTKATVTKALPKELASAASVFDVDIKLEMVPDYTTPVKPKVRARRKTAQA